MRTLAPAALLLLLGGCAGSSCDALPGLRAERDAARRGYASAAPGQGDHDGLHALERRVYDLEASCG